MRWAFGLIMESRRIDHVHNDSIVGVADGRWIGNSFLAWQESE